MNEETTITEKPQLSASDRVQSFFYSWIGTTFLIIGVIVVFVGFAGFLAMLMYFGNKVLEQG